MLAHDEVEVDVVSLDSTSSLNPDEVPLPCRIYMEGSERRSYYAYSKRFRQWMQDNVSKYSAVVIHGLWQYHSLAASRACRKRGVPYFIFTHGMLDPWFNRTYPTKYLKKLVYWLLFEASSLRRANAVLFTCDQERKLARRSFPFYRVREAVVGLGTAMPEFDMTELRSSFSATPPAWAQRPYLLFMSRIHKKKGLDILIEAYAKLRKEGSALPDLVIAGPAQQPEYKAQLQDNFPQEGIHWIGPLSGESKWQALSCAEAMVLTSHQENFGIVVVEALMVGTPVLISNQINIWREVEQCNAGLVEDDTLSGAKRLLERWLRLNSGEQKQMREAAHRAFEAHFEINRSTERLLTLIGERGQGSLE